MEPLNCRRRPAGRLRRWTGTQGQSFDHFGAIEITGLKPEQVNIHTTLLGGGLAGGPRSMATLSARRCRLPRL